jgi:AcrR family transcriptional regulator
MSRRDTGARERLQRAGLELYASQGFDDTTVRQIAESVGLAERTFFRHFGDKREVVFSGEDLFLSTFNAAVRDAPGDLAPYDLLTRAVTDASRFFNRERHEFSRLRREVIASHPGLQERELLKMASLTSAIAAALQARGIAEPAAALLAGHGVTVFRFAFDQWIEAAEDRTLVDIEVELFQEFKAALPH